MHHLRRLIAVLIGSVASLIAAASVASAQILHDPVGAGVSGAASSASAATPFWEFIGLVALGVLMAVAIVGLGYALSHSRRPEASQRSQTAMRA